MRHNLLSVLLIIVSVSLQAQRIEPIPFADFEQWAVRYIKESAIVGGKTSVLYAVAPTDTIRTNSPFEYGKNGNIWSVSNAYAKVMGVEKGSGTLTPEYRDTTNGYCCRMDSKLEVVRALGMFDLRVLVAGTLFTGRTIEPIRTQKDPYQNIDFGVPFTQTPTALIFDYKAVISPDNTLLYAKGGVGKPKEIAGHDEGHAFVVLQRRWEDAEGNIYAERVATGYERFKEDVPQWQNNHTLRLLYGDITTSPIYKQYTNDVKLNNVRRAMNKQGKIVPIQEVGWAKEGTLPTHVIINLSSGCYEAFVGHDGNTLWVDNLQWVFED